MKTNIFAKIARTVTVLAICVGLSVGLAHVTHAAEFSNGEIPIQAFDEVIFPCRPVSP